MDTKRSHLFFRWLSGIVLIVFLTFSQTVTRAGAAPNVIATIPLGGNPFGVGVNPNTNRIYVANNGINTVSVIDAATNTVTATVTVGSSPTGVGVNQNSNRIYVANSGSNNVSVIDGNTNAVIAP
jgi:YVTN family beta-propeller protein